MNQILTKQPFLIQKGDSSTFECAHQLGKLCENKHLVVNLIPYNQTDVKDKLSCPSEEHMKEFQRIVTSYGSFCTIRRTMGADIAGACGQLVVSKETKELVDIEDGPFETKKKTLLTPKPIKQKHRSEAPERDEKGGDGKAAKDPLDKWIRFLSVGTALSASVCVLSVGMMLIKRRHK